MMDVPAGSGLLDLPEVSPAPRWYGKVGWGISLALLGMIALFTISSLLTMYLFYAGQWLAGIGGVAFCGAILALMRLARRRIGRIPTWAWLTGVLLLGLVVRLAFVIGVPYELSDDFQVYHDSGVLMSQEWTLGHDGTECHNPDGTYGGDTLRCFLPPGQIFSLGVLYSLFGPHVLAGQIANVFWSTGTILGVWFLARSLFGLRIARAASVLLALLPSDIFACMLIGAEVMQTFWFIAGMCLFVALVDRKFTWHGALAAGLMVGAASLVRPTFVLLPIVLGGHMLLSWRSKSRAIVAALLVGLGTAAVVLPWTYRNYRVTGGFVLISSNGGGNLYSANNDAAAGAYTAAAWQYVYDNATNDLELQRIGKAKAVEWIRANPGRFAYLCMRKFPMFWHTDKEIAWWAITHPYQMHPQRADLAGPNRWGEPAEAFSTAYYTLLTVAALAAVWLWRRRLMADRAWMVIPILCVYFSAIHMVFESQGKYHFPLVPLLCVLAAAITVRARRRAVAG